MDQMFYLFGSIFSGIGSLVFILHVIDLFIPIFKDEVSRDEIKNIIDNEERARRDSDFEIIKAHHELVKKVNELSEKIEKKRKSKLSTEK